MFPASAGPWLPFLFPDTVLFNTRQLVHTNGPPLAEPLEKQHPPISRSLAHPPMTHPSRRGSIPASVFCRFPPASAGGGWKSRCLSSQELHNNDVIHSVLSIPPAKNKKGVPNRHARMAVPGETSVEKKFQGKSAEAFLTFCRGVRDNSCKI